MYGKALSVRRTHRALTVAAALATLVVPAAAAGSSNGPGLVPGKLGSADPRETDGKVVFAPGIVPGKLGSQDPRETAAESASSSSIVAGRLGSQDPRDTASATVNGIDGDYMFRDYSRGTHWGSASQPGAAVSPDDSFDMTKLGIGLGSGIGVVLLAALGIAVRQRHAAHQLRNA